MGTLNQSYWEQLQNSQHAVGNTPNNYISGIVNNQQLGTSPVPLTDMPQQSTIPSDLQQYDNQLGLIDPKFLKDPVIMKSLVDGRNNLLGDQPWSMNGVLDKIGSYIGTDAAGLGSLKDFATGGLGIYSGIGGLINDKRIGIAQDNYNFNKNMTLAKYNEAMKDKAKYAAAGKASADKYYGRDTTINTAGV